jgi:hypothetical protein
MPKFLPIATSVVLITVLAAAVCAKPAADIQGTYESNRKLQSLLVKLDGPDTYNITFSERHLAAKHCGGSSFSYGAPHLTLDSRGHDVKLDPDEWRRYIVRFKNGGADITFEDYSTDAGKADPPHFSEIYHLRKVSSSTKSSELSR